jgi:hypothetical protein
MATKKTSTTPIRSSAGTSAAIDTSFPINSDANQQLTPAGNGKRGLNKRNAAAAAANSSPARRQAKGELSGKRFIDDQAVEASDDELSNDGEIIQPTSVQSKKKLKLVVESDGDDNELVMSSAGNGSGSGVGVGGGRVKFTQMANTTSTNTNTKNVTTPKSTTTKSSSSATTTTSSSSSSGRTFGFQHSGTSTVKRGILGSPQTGNESYIFSMDAKDGSVERTKVKLSPAFNAKPGQIYDFSVLDNTVIKVKREDFLSHDWIKGVPLSAFTPDPTSKNNGGRSIYKYNYHVLAYIQRVKGHEEINSKENNKTYHKNDIQATVLLEGNKFKMDVDLVLWNELSAVELNDHDVVILFDMKTCSKEGELTWNSASSGCVCFCDELEFASEFKFAVLGALDHRESLCMQNMEEDLQ